MPAQATSLGAEGKAGLATAINTVFRHAYLDATCALAPKPDALPPAWMPQRPGW